MAKEPGVGRVDRQGSVNEGADNSLGVGIVVAVGGVVPKWEDDLKIMEVASEAASNKWSYRRDRKSVV